jgi:hypothetical protein
MLGYWLIKNFTHETVCFVKYTSLEFILRINTLVSLKLCNLIKTID